MAAGRIEHIEALLGSSPDLVIAVAASGAVVFANPAASARWNAGGPAAEGFPEEHRAAFVHAHARAVASGEAGCFEWGEHGPAGARAWFLCRVSPIRDRDTIASVLCVSADVTELNRARERLRRTEQLLVDTQGVAHMGIWDWDVSEPNATWSTELYNIYGLDPASYVPSYASYLTLVHPEDRQRVIDATNRVFNEHVPYSHDERILRPDGSIRYLHTWAYPVLDDAGTLRRLVGVCQDITDRKRAEERVRELNVSLEQRVAERTRTIESSLRDLEAFNAMVSHDLRAPLQVLQLSAGAIARVLSTKPQDAGKHVEHIQRAVTRMSSLVDGLLALARVGNSPLERVEVDLSTIATELLADLARTSGGRKVSTRVASGLRCHGDADLLRSVMQNLLENAWKYSAKAAQAQIEVDAVDHEGGRAFFVRDNGIGFPAEEASRLFAPFTRLQVSSDFPGTGIGLATVQRIIERHGGRVWAHSEGQGATFFFHVPDRGVS